MWIVYVSGESEQLTLKSGRMTIGDTNLLQRHLWWIYKCVSNISVVFFIPQGTPQKQGKPQRLGLNTIYSTKKFFRVTLHIGVYNH